eukprot:scaffold144926_cov85-Attheya_sp.AAC.1
MQEIGKASDWNSKIECSSLSIDPSSKWSRSRRNIRVAIERNWVNNQRKAFRLLKEGKDTPLTIER